MERVSACQFLFLSFLVSSSLVRADALSAAVAKAEVTKILTVLSRTAGFSQFGSFLHLVGPSAVSNALQRAGGVTLLVASDAAVLDASNSLTQAIHNPKQLLRLVNFQILQGRLSLASLAASKPGRLLTTADGSHMVVTAVLRGAVTLATPGDNNPAHRAHVIARNIFSDAYVNLIAVDRILLPPSF